MEEGHSERKGMRVGLSIFRLQYLFFPLSFVLLYSSSFLPWSPARECWCIMSQLSDSRPDDSDQSLQRTTVEAEHSNFDCRQPKDCVTAAFPAKHSRVAEGERGGDDPLTYGSATYPTYDTLRRRGGCCIQVYVQRNAKNVSTLHLADLGAIYESLARYPIHLLGTL